MKKLTYLFLLASVSFLSCEKEGIEGPNLNDLFGELNICLLYTSDAADDSRV